MCNALDMQNDPEDVIGTAEAATRLNIHRSTLTRWVKRNILSPYIQGAGRTGELFFRRRDVEELANRPLSQRSFLADVHRASGEWVSGVSLDSGEPPWTK